MRVAILGANSHIGQGLLEAWNSRSYELVAFVRRADEFHTYLASRYGEHKILVADYSDLHDQTFDLIVNCVGYGDPARIRKDGSRVFQVIAAYDDLCIDYLRARPETRYIHLSSGAVYGSQFDAPVDRSSVCSIAVNDLQAQDAYRIAKLHAEAKHRVDSALAIVDLRIFSYFSRFQDLSAQFFLSDVAKALVSSTELQTGASDMVRDFVSFDEVSAIIEAIYAAPPANESIDVRSKAAVAKFELLEALQEEYGLKYALTDGQVAASATGQKNLYYSQRDVPAWLSYAPTRSALQCVLDEMRHLVPEEKPR